MFLCVDFYRGDIATSSPALMRDNAWIAVWRTYYSLLNLSHGECLTRENFRNCRINLPLRVFI